MRWLREQRAHLIGWWRARKSPAPRKPDALAATDLAPAFTALSFFFRPAALIAGALYVHERVEQRRRYELALKRARIAWGLLTLAGLALLLLPLVR